MFVAKCLYSLSILQLTELLLFFDELRDICEWFACECDGLESTERRAAALLWKMEGPLARGLGVTVTMGWTLPIKAKKQQKQKKRICWSKYEKISEIEFPKENSIKKYVNKNCQSMYRLTCLAGIMCQMAAQWVQLIGDAMYFLHESVTRFACRRRCNFSNATYIRYGALIGCTQQIIGKRIAKWKRKVLNVE